MTPNGLAQPSPAATFHAERGEGAENTLHPSEVLYAGSRPFPRLSACEHYAGTERRLVKALELQNVRGSIFDITADCEDGAPAGGELAHAGMIARFIAAPANIHGRIGARIHDVRHPLWREELDLLIQGAGARLAYLVLPKPECADDVRVQIEALNERCRHYNILRQIPVHVLIETHGALHEVWQIAALPHVESLDFGLMDFVSAHHGAIPASAMKSPGQFSHPLITRAKTEIAAAALANGLVPSHNVSTELTDMALVHADARRAREEFGFLRMWSIHPAQIDVIVRAMQPDDAETREAAEILLAAQAAAWGPIRKDGRLHDRASYRYYWTLLERAHATGAPVPATVRHFFQENQTS